MRQHLGVGFTGEFMAGGTQLVPQRRVIFDDAVMNNGDPVVGDMRVRIPFGHAAMGRPAGMAKPGVAGQRPVAHRGR